MRTPTAPVAAPAERLRAPAWAAHFTPAPVAARLVRESLGRWLWRGRPPLGSTGTGAEGNRREWRAPEEVLQLRILDPACGDGAFLVAARDAIVEYLQARARSLGESPPGPILLRRILTEVLHGVDLDPRAITAARERLQALDVPDALRSPREPLPLGLRCGNTLVTPAMADRARPSARARQRLRPWDPHGADGFPSVLSRGGFDVVLGNPPFAAGRTLDPLHRRIFAAEYALGASTQPDLFQLFLERTLGELLRPDGLHAFLVPDALLARDEHRAARQRVAASLRIDRIIALGPVFGGPPPTAAALAQPDSFPRSARLAVSVIGLIGTKEPAAGGRPTVTVQRRSSRSTFGSRALPRRWLCPADGGPWAIAAPRAWFGPRGFRASVERAGQSLGDLLARGTEGLCRGEELGKSRLRPLSDGEPCARGCVPILAGEDVHRGVVSAPGHQVPAALLRKATHVHRTPRVLLVKTGGGIVAAPSFEPLPVLQSVYVLRLADDARRSIGEAALAAVLASAILTTYAWFRWTSGKALHPQLTLGNVRTLPLPDLALLAAARGRLEALAVEAAPGPSPLLHRKRASGASRGAAAIAAARALDELVADLYGMDLVAWDSVITPALSALPRTQRSAWFTPRMASPPR